MNTVGESGHRTSTTWEETRG